MFKWVRWVAWVRGKMRRSGGLDGRHCLCEVSWSIAVGILEVLTKLKEGKGGVGSFNTGGTGSR